MIKYEELKLNNSVISKKHKGLITEIRDLHPDSLGLWANPLAIYKYKDIDPIPLTDDWLLRFGFVQNPDWTIRWGDHSRFTLDDEFRFHVDRGAGAVRIAWNVEHVHTLQNLFYSLTGIFLERN
jgi:hypothetical protein